MKDAITDILRVEIEDGIGLICLNKPPVNALGVALRTAIHAAYGTLRDDPAVKAIVLYGEGRFFSAGADIKDFGKADLQPTLPQVLKALQDSDKPVVTALHGVAFGGALELALATHLRVGLNGLRIALPEVRLGLLPGAGGAQRLPRLTGIAAAIDIICSGREVGAQEALGLGIIDRLADGSPREAGLAAARDILAGRLTPRQTDRLSAGEDPQAVEAARQRLTAKRPALLAPLKALEAVTAASLPIEEGLARERALFMELMQGEERAGLVHAFFAERATSKIPESTAPLRLIEQVAVIGGGTMGVGIATSLLIAGYRVQLIEAQGERLPAVRAAIEANLAGALKRGKLTANGHGDALLGFSCGEALEAAANADLVIEAIFEDISAKTELFARLDRICKTGAILASNTSYLDVNLIAEATSRPADVIGLHFFSPAHIMRLLEVVVADRTAPDCVSTAFALARRLGKVPVRAGVCDGFIGNRILTQYRRAAEYLLLDGASFEEIDSALEEFGFAMGPFAVSDLAGLDVAKATRDRKAATRPPDERYSRVADLICAQGWYGRKTGRGYYIYDKAAPRRANPDVLAIIDDERRVLGITARAFSNQEIVDRCLTAMIAEAVRVIEEGVALRPVDVDAVELFGYGFPRHRGGPMFQADRIGLPVLIDRIERFSREDPQFWRVPELLRRMAQAGEGFAPMNDQPLSTTEKRNSHE
ncbi:3-hydroxyacyl-CoA dehydrogenase NAD-binding domain-containing protein [Paracoccus seriniphilus]|uniref:3-hydroxyacyl-CoA dehydrogenase n=1 Tax=Paracoccus seriniphilus TaxID=184748 RepID=A0A239PRB5_9RHOB|nr:3-hydroxyacyl-CoA dehydrogenase NAD-binding domain-containing protein [Paracoccus seriniphilus]WCR12771.1 enoyl-CoA hydratase/isomerase family protein [Paracoccus seriniphilus]SNT72815.1 3-hydroxyacyl-CoA dehydrogenase [Paracoccus seriniphilus]